MNGHWVSPVKVVSLPILKITYEKNTINDWPMPGHVL